MSDFLTRIEKLSPKRLALLADELQRRLTQAEQSRTEPIAIVGLGCRFPGANGAEAFWQLLDEGRDAVSEVPPNRWDVDAFYDPDPDTPGRMSTRWGGFLDQVDQFDAPFFGISRREAVGMDPQHRLLLETCWEALEYAGQSPRALSGSSTGVFLGISTGDYFGLLRADGLEAMDTYIATGTSHSIAAGRLSYVLGLQGPNVAIDTACSSSLVAIHLACQSLRMQECRMALAGGVNAIVAPDVTVALSKAHMMAPDGRCKTFDASADGFVRGEGCGILVLKRLSDAQADGDSILAVLRGSAVNQDGRSSGITAPNGAAQRQVLRQAMQAARVNPSDIDYIEAHGTGTSLGDPIEAHALAAEFHGRSERSPLVIGSVKANIGHLESAAGVAGLMKVVLALQHHRIPSQLHFHTMNPHIDWGGMPVDIPVGGRDWAPSDRPRIAGVSSFGFSGTNAHIIVEEAPQATRAAPERDRPVHLLALSARTEQTLQRVIDRYAHQQWTGDVTLGDLCFTANTGRSHFNERAVFLASSLDELRTALREPPLARGASEGRPKVAFLCTGQGSQKGGMGHELYETEPVFRQALDQCAELLRPHLDRPLLDLLYGDGQSLLDETRYTQPALFAIEWALAQLWKSWGIEPAVLLGHSVGEYAALCIAGVWSLEDGLAIIAERGRLMHQLGAGWGMTSAQCTPAQIDEARRGLESQLSTQLSIAAINAPDSTVVSGPIEALTTFEARLSAAGVRTNRLPVSQGFHSAQMDEVAEVFARRVQAFDMHTPRVAVVSSVTGQLLGIEELRDPGYWRRQVREPVRFQSAMETLAALKYEVFLEIGPSATLAGLGRQCIGRDGQSWLTSLRRDRSDVRQMLESLGQLYVRGADINWVKYDAPYQRHRIVLPTYPFQRQRYWIENRGSISARATIQPIAGHAMLQGRIPAAVPIYQAHLSTEAFPYLGDHQVGDTAVLPGSVFVELALAAASNTFERANMVQDLRLREPLYLRSDEHTVQVVLTRERPDEGTFQILSHPSSEPNASWTLHASGALKAASRSARDERGQLDTLRRNITTTVAPEGFFQALQTRGINLGPACQGIRALWATAGEVLAEVVLDPSLAGEQQSYRMHPALLDASLQVFGVALWRHGVTGETRVLSRIGEFTLSGTPSARLWCHATLDAAGESGHLRIWNETGDLVAEATDLQTSVVGTDTTDDAQVQPVDDWFYQLSWQPQPQRSVSGLGTILADGHMPEQLRKQASALFTQYQLERYQDAQPEMDALVAAYAGRALQTIGCDLTPGRKSTTAAWIQTGHVVAQHQRLFGRLLDILAEDGVLRQVGDQWEVLSTPATDSELLVETLLHRFPVFTTEIELTARCGRALAGVLQGTADPLHLLFPDGSVDELVGLYTQSPAAQTFNRLVQRAVQDAIAAVPADRRIRILEIGAGTGGTTAYVAPVLPADRVEYFFTDVSPLFLARAEERFAQYPFMRYETLNIEEPTTEPDRYDIIIAANVLHATVDLRQTLEHARQQLVPGGLLLLIEGTRPERWVDLTFGMTDGWWRFQDHDLRPKYALLDSPTWLTVLQSTGFEHPAVVQPAQGSQQVVLLAQASESSLAGRWLIMAGASDDSTETAMSLQRRITDGGGTAVLASPDQPSASALYADDYEHVVYLSGEAVPSEVNAESLEASETATKGLIDTMQAMETSPRASSPRLWIVTRGAQSIPAAPTTVAASQAPLWGVGRTFALESPAHWGGVCDLDPTASHDDNVTALLNAIQNPDGEDQYVVRAGISYVPRIERRAPLPATSPSFSSTGQYLITGGLGNLGLRVAEWLVEHGARHIVLNGRTALPDRSRWTSLLSDMSSDVTTVRRIRAVQALEARGATVTMLPIDLSHTDADAALAAAFAPGELRGVFHAAAAFDITPIERLGVEALRSVLRPKTFGTMALSQLVRDVGADFFVLFSSTTSLLGVGGMAAYAAANQFLDAFAHQLRAEGLSALSINWGTWAELGDLSEETRKNYLRAGLHPMPSADALELLGRTLDADEVQLTIAQIDWTALKAVYQARRRRPLLDQIANRPTVALQAASSASNASADHLDTLALLSELERNRRIVAVIRREAASVLGLRADEVDTQQGLFDMGMDSLMSVELRARLEKTLGRKLPSTLTFNYPSVQALASYIGGLVQVQAPAAQPEPVPVPVVSSPPISELDDRSEDELATILSNALQSLD